ncbi:MAG TPA: tetratricopeptide repeat protein, partial [bacterium]|nr:tetratricopeptide repeat protein [bacterium]
AVVIVSTVVFLMQMNSRAKESEASAQFQSAVKQYQQDLAASTISFDAQSEDGTTQVPDMKVQTKSIGSFQAIYDNYPGTDAGRHALYMVAVSELNQGQYEEAIASFDNFVSKYSDSLLAASSLLGKATAEYNMGRTEQSLESLKQIETRYPNYPLKDVLTYEMAKRYQAMDRIPDARQKYEEVVEKYPDSSWKTLSEKALEELDNSKDKSDNNSA